MSQYNNNNGNKPKFSVALQTDKYQKLINNTLKDTKRAQRFIASISSAVAVNKELQECDAGTILSAAFLGESLNLSPSPQLGQYYMIPFDDKKKGITVATFVLGYKGYIQLAIRSGQYRKLNALEIKQGELKRYNPLSEEIEVELIDDYEERENAETIGYYAMFEYLNGFKKVLYWSREKMLKYADKYSSAFSLESKTIYTKNGSMTNKVSYNDYLAGNYDKRDEWMYSSFWYKDFDGMAKKTMLRQLISKWGIMSTELVSAYESDGAVINKDGSREFVHNDDDDIIVQQDDPVVPEMHPMQEQIEVVSSEGRQVNLDDL